MEDRKLIRLCQKDPNVGMEQLMKQYAGLVYAVVKSRLPESLCVSSDIEDCVADVFSEFYLGLSAYDLKKSSIKTYLCVMARNNATDLSRKRAKMQGQVWLDDAQNLLQIADDFDFESELSEQELRREVLLAVKQLGEPDTSIIMRKYYLGQSTKQIADALGMSVSNVDTRTHRALHKLRKRLEGKV